MTRGVKLEYESSPGSGLMSSSDFQSDVLALPKTLKTNITYFKDDLAISYHPFKRRARCSVKRGKR